MLSDLDRADRLAIPLPFVQAVGQPDGPAFMTALISWRSTAPKIDRDLWFRKMVTLRAPPLTIGQRSASGTAKSAFYDALLQKCLNLYGGSGRAADPLALARHPWTLTTHEFASAFQAVTGGDLPSTVPDERVQ